MQGLPVYNKLVNKVKPSSCMVKVINNGAHGEHRERNISR
jgi:hypothetical protein